MRINSAGTRIFAFLFFLWISVAMPAREAWCDESKDSWFTGNWTGKVTAIDNKSRAKKSVDISLTISPAATSAHGGKYRVLKYGNDRKCSLKAEYPDSSGGNTRNFTFSITADKPCDKLSLGSLNLKQSGKALSYKADSQDRNYSEQGELTGN